MHPSHRKGLKPLTYSVGGRRYTAPSPVDVPTPSSNRSAENEVEWVPQAPSRSPATRPNTARHELATDVLQHMQNELALLREKGEEYQGQRLPILREVTSVLAIRMPSYRQLFDDIVIELDTCSALISKLRQSCSSLTVKLHEERERSQSLAESIRQGKADADQCTMATIGSLKAKLESAETERTKACETAVELLHEVAELRKAHHEDTIKMNLLIETIRESERRNRVTQQAAQDGNAALAQVAELKEAIAVREASILELREITRETVPKNLMDSVLKERQELLHQSSNREKTLRRMVAIRNGKLEMLNKQLAMTKQPFSPDRVEEWRKILSGLELALELNLSGAELPEELVQKITVAFDSWRTTQSKHLEQVHSGTSDQGQKFSRQGRQFVHGSPTMFPTCLRGSGIVELQRWTSEEIMASMRGFVMSCSLTRSNVWEVSLSDANEWLKQYLMKRYAGLWVSWGYTILHCGLECSTVQLPLAILRGEVPASLLFDVASIVLEAKREADLLAQETQKKRIRKRDFIETLSPLLTTLQADVELLRNRLGPEQTFAVDEFDYHHPFMAGLFDLTCAHTLGRFRDFIFSLAGPENSSVVQASRAWDAILKYHPTISPTLASKLFPDGLTSICEVSQVLKNVELERWAGRDTLLASPSPAET
jgi:hypothetical protein